MFSLTFNYFPRELPQLLTGRRGHACGGYTFEERNVSVLVLTTGSADFSMLRDPFCKTLDFYRFFSSDKELLHSDDDRDRRL